MSQRRAGIDREDLGKHQQVMILEQDAELKLCSLTKSSRFRSFQQGIPKRGCKCFAQLERVIIGHPAKPCQVSLQGLQGAQSVLAARCHLEKLTNVPDGDPKGASHTPLMQQELESPATGPTRRT